jgi:signal peptidase I
VGDVESKPNAPGVTNEGAAPAAEVKPNLMETGAVKADEDENESALKEWIELLVRAGAWALLIYIFLFQISIVEGESMLPTFHNSDRLVIDKLTYRLGSVHRYDVVVFEAVDVDKVPRRPKDYIKRVIGLPGDKIEVFEGAVWVNGKKLEEKFGPTFTNVLRDPMQRHSFEVPPHQYFVMGDNRDYSKDSRIDDGHFGRQSLGFVAGRQIRGIVRLRFWPWKEWTWFSRQ